MSSAKMYFLGPQKIEKGGRQIQVSRRKAFALLVYLATTGQQYPREVLADMFWPEAEPGHGRTSLRRIISDLNVALGTELFYHQGETLGINPDFDYWVDAIEFRALIQPVEGHGHSPIEVCDTCLPSLTQALSLYRDDFLKGFSLPDSPGFDDWQFFEAENLRKEYSSLLEKLVRYYQKKNELTEAIRLARRWASLDSLLEGPQSTLMVLYAQAGQRTLALRQYQDYSLLLKQELGIVPGSDMVALYKLIEKAPSPNLQEVSQGDLKNEKKILPSSDLTTNHSPVKNEFPGLSSTEKYTQGMDANIHLTPFIGRKKELEEIKRILRDPDCRLLSLVGPGGTGKTRLALQIFSEMQPDYPDGVFFIPLEATRTEESVIRSIAKAYKLPFFNMDDLKAQLLSFLEKKQQLLILDNFEHIIQLAPLTLEIIKAAPGVDLLITSHTPLNLVGEYTYQVGGLSYPDVHTYRRLVRPEEWLVYDAIRLFLQSARRALPGFEPQAHDWFQIARICILLDGLPLGIILAAGWIEVLSPGEIAKELTRDLDFLETSSENIPERQRSLRRVFVSSLNLLGEKDIPAFLRLSIFQGGFTRQAAQAVTGVSLATLKTLVSRSLLRPDIHFGRYFMHPLLQQFALARLKESGEDKTTIADHCTYFSELVASRTQSIKGHQQMLTLNEIEVEFENIRAAWLWAASQHQYDRIDQMITTMFIFCVQRNLWDEAEDIFQYARDQFAPAVGEAPLPVWGKLLSYFYGDEDDRYIQVKQSLNIAILHGDEDAIAHCKAELGWLAIKNNDFYSAKTLFIESVDHYRHIGDQYFVILLQRSVALCALSLGDWELAQQASRESLSLSREFGDRLRIAECLNTHGSVVMFMGSYGEARNNFQQAIALQEGKGNWSDLILNYLMLGWLEFLMGVPEECQRLAGEVIKLTSGVNMMEARAIALIEQALGLLFEGQMEQCRQLSIESDQILADPNLKPWTSAMNPCMSLLIQWGKTILAIGLGEKQSGMHEYKKLLESPFFSHSDAVQSWCLPLGVWIYFDLGEPIKGIELLSAATNHSRPITGWLTRWNWASQKLREMELVIGKKKYHLAWESGKKLDLPGVASALSKDFHTRIEPCEDANSSQVLLSSRLETKPGVRLI